MRFALETANVQAQTTHFATVMDLISNLLVDASKDTFI